MFLKRSTGVGAASILAVGVGCTYAIQIPTSDERAAVVDFYQAHPDAKERDFNDYFDEGAPGRQRIGEHGFAHQDFRDADHFCKNIMVNAQRASNTYAGWGWGVAVIGAVGTGTLTGLAAKEDTKEGVAITGGGAALSAAFTVIGVYLLTRSSAAARASLESASGMQESMPVDRWKKCVEARLHWQDSNAKATEAAAAVFKENAKASSGKEGTKDAGPADAPALSTRDGGTGT